MSLPENRFTSPYDQHKRDRRGIGIFLPDAPTPDYVLCCNSQRTVPFGDSEDLQICTACGRKYQRVKQPVKQIKKGRGKPFVKSIGLKKKSNNTPADLEGAIPGAVFSEDRDMSNG